MALPSRHRPRTKAALQSEKTLAILRKSQMRTTILQHWQASRRYDTSQTLVPIRTSHPRVNTTWAHQTRRTAKTHKLRRRAIAPPHHIGIATARRNTKNSNRSAPPGQGECHQLDFALECLAFSVFCLLLSNGVAWWRACILHSDTKFMSHSPDLYGPCSTYEKRLFGRSSFMTALHVERPLLRLFTGVLVAFGIPH